VTGVAASARTRSQIAMAKIERCALFPGLSVPGGDIGILVLNDGFQAGDALRFHGFRETRLTILERLACRSPSVRSPVLRGPRPMARIASSQLPAPEPPDPRDCLRLLGHTDSLAPFPPPVPATPP